MATRNAIAVWFSEPKQDTTAAAHHTTAQANCIFHFRISAEVALAVPSMAPTMATKTWSSYLPLMPRDRRRVNMEMPMAIQTELMARPRVVSGWLLGWREISAPIKTQAPTMVTGQASLLWPQVAQAMAT